MQSKSLSGLGDDHEKLRYLHEVYQLNDLELTIDQCNLSTIDKSTLKGRKISYSFERTLEENFTVFDIGTIVNFTTRFTFIDYGKDKKDVYRVPSLDLNDYVPQANFPTKEGQWRLLKQRSTSDDLIR